MAKERDKPRHKPEEPETYDIVEPVEDVPTTKFDPALARRPEAEPLDTGTDLDIDAEGPPPPPPSGADYAMDGSGKPRPKLLENIPEPKFVDPQVQAMRREDARVRAAMEAAEEDARRQKVRLTLIGVVLVLAALVGAMVYVFL